MHPSNAPRKVKALDLSAENRVLVDRLTTKLGLKENEVVDRVLTFFRAYWHALNLSGRDAEGTTDLLKKTAPGESGRAEDLFERLLLRFYQEHDNLNDFELLVKELGENRERSETR